MGSNVGFCDGGTEKFVPRIVGFIEGTLVTRREVELGCIEGTLVINPNPVGVDVEISTFGCIDGIFVITLNPVGVDVELGIIDGDWVGEREPLIGDTVGSIVGDKLGYVGFCDGSVVG